MGPDLPRSRARTRVPGGWVRGLFPEWSALLAPLQLSLQFPDPGLGFFGAGLKVLVSDDVLPGLRVVPAQMSVVPPDEEVEHAAVPLEDPFPNGLDGDWLVSSTREPVPGQKGPMELPGLVEPPILGDP